MPEENVELVRRFIDAFSRRDRETFAALLHPEVEWDSFVTPLLGIAETMHGRDELVRVTFERIPQVLDDWHAVPLEVEALADGQVLSVARYEARGSSSGAEITMETTAIYRFDSGVILHVREFRTREEAVEAAGLSE